jgi:hypothetical protein
MTFRRDFSIRWVPVVAALALLLIVALLRHALKPVTVEGAVVQLSADTKRQSPIVDVSVTASGNLAAAPCTSDFSGYFRLTLRPWVKRGQPITLTFRHPDYVPVTLKGTVGDGLYVVRMASIHPDDGGPPNRPSTVISNVVVRYFMETTTSENIGSEVKLFQVANTSNVPCNHAPVCSPDNRWKAADVSFSLDAGAGNEFRNARVSCIAGPCPFTRIESDQFSAGGRTISVIIRNWSDTTTFALQAEVFRVQVNDIVRQYYPVIIGHMLNFTPPPNATGLTIEAELNGTEIDFPLGPDPVMSWAKCKVSALNDGARVYRCELEPGYQFR